MGSRLLIDCFKELPKTLKSAVPQPQHEATYGKLLYLFVLLLIIT